MKTFFIKKQVVTGDLKSGYCTVMWDCGTSEISQHQPHQRPVFIQRWYCVYGGIGKESPVINSFWKDEWLIPTQLGQLKAVLDEKWPESVNRKHIILHQDNARLFVSLMTRQKLLQLVWKVLIHLLHSPTIVPSNIHLFWSLQNSQWKKFQFPKRLEKAPETVLCSKKKKFWNDGIMKLPEENGRS